MFSLSTIPDIGPVITGGFGACFIPYVLKLRDLALYSVFNLKIAPEDMSEGMKGLLKSIKYRIENELPTIDLDFTKFDI